jgi:hypothetical protein
MNNRIQVGESNDGGVGRDRISPGFMWCRIRYINLPWIVRAVREPPLQLVARRGTMVRANDRTLNP